MNVSKTELTALLKQVFEALGFSSGEHQNAAEMVVWAQMCGLEGLPELRRGLPRLLKQGLSTLRPVFEDDSHTVIDANHASCLHCADTATNLAYVKALTHGAFSITVLNCHDRKLAIKAMVDCCRHDLACSLHWYDEIDDSIIHVAKLLPDTGAKGFPGYTVSKLSQENKVDDRERHSLFIRCSSKQAQLEKTPPVGFAQLQVESGTMPPEALQYNYRAALNQGLVVEEDFQRVLQDLAAVVLVESSEQSRMGAGA